MRVSLVVLALAAVPFAAAAEPKKSKPIWEWSDDERIAVRVDPASIRDRAKDAEPGSIVIDGMKNPELFMPSELLNVLTHDADASTPRSRDRFTAAIREAGWDPQTFWTTIQQITGPYWRMELDALAIQKRLHTETLTVEERRALQERRQKLQLDACAGRAGAVAEADARFGPAFRKFLYTAVAPKISTVSDHSPEVEAQRLSYLARGCR